jgi:hypothetical protein
VRPARPSRSRRTLVARPSLRTTPAARSRGQRRSPRRREGRRQGSRKAGGAVFVTVRRGSCDQSTPPRVAGAYAVLDTLAIRTGSVAWKRESADRGRRALHGRGHPRWPASGGDRGRHRG